MPTWFVWARGSKGPEPQLHYDVLQRDYANPEHPNSRALAVHKLSAETMALVKSQGDGTTRRSMEILAAMYPPPETKP